MRDQKLPHRLKSSNQYLFTVRVETWALKRKGELTEHWDESDKIYNVHLTKGTKNKSGSVTASGSWGERH